MIKNKTFKLIYLALVSLILVTCVSSASSVSEFPKVVKEKEPHFTLEQLGGQAYYKPLDGRFEDGVQFPLISYTPYSYSKSILKGTGLKGNNFTQITVEGSSKVFTQEDLGKSFCGLFAHHNPNEVNPLSVDAYYPQEVGSRYSKIVAVIDAFTIIVDFEYNGGDRLSPKPIKGGKGYVFFDNSLAWEKLKKAHQAKENKIVEIIFKSKRTTGFLQSTYVIPEYETWVVNPAIDLTLWADGGLLMRLKIGYEDYYQHEKRTGKSIIKQSKYIFSLGNIKGEHNLTFHGQIVPPHRRILEANTWHAFLVNGRKRTGITAFVGCNQLIEEEAIKAGKGLTEETFISFSGSAISGGGKNEGEGVALDIAEFGYTLFKDYVQRGQMFTQMNAAYGGGNYLVVENADIYFYPQSSVNPTSQKLKIKINSGKDAFNGFANEIKEHKSNLLPYVFEINGAGNFYKVFALGGSNRLNILALEGKESVYTFMVNVNGVRRDNPGELIGYWEYCYSLSDKWNWGLEKKKGAFPGRTGGKLIPIEQIPQKGKRYTISRDYYINEKFGELIDSKNAKIATVNKNAKAANRKPKNGQMFSNVVRTAVCWTTILNKYANDIDIPKDIPVNGKPLALQPGDQFRIPAYKGSTHDAKMIYTVTRKERGKFPMFPAEFVGIESRGNWEYNFSNAQSYRFFWCQLDKDLPATVGLTFEIEMVFSGSEELLDGKPRDAVQTYKGIGRIGENGLAKPNTKNAQGYGGYGVNMKIIYPKFNAGESLGHICYSQAELTEWYKNVNWHNGFYRENTNRGRGFDKYTIKNSNGETFKVNPLARYSQGKTFVDCTGGPKGQYSDHLKDFMVRDAILAYLGIQLKENEKAKFRMYNSLEVRTKGVRNPEKYLEIHTTSENAPDMPKECRELINQLSKRNN